MNHLDTHVVLWLYAGQTERFPPAVRQRLAAGPLAISPMVLLEVQYLFELGRASQPGATVIRDLRARSGLRIADAGFERVVEAAAALAWTRDPFDRLIAAQAIAERATLLTADRALLAHVPGALWG